MSSVHIVNGVLSKKKRDPALNDSDAPGPSNSIAKREKGDSKLETSLVDPIWETLDPTPDVHALFVLYNDMFFQGALAGCEVRWSPRMTSCAGICSYEGRGGLCSIRLSKPLLTLRPRKDLVETLLHEMIHAYLFVTVRNRDRDGHGPEFQLHMYRINARAGTNITIYHTFYAEVANYKQHWWRCEGPCRNRRPFFGWVKRASNRAPGPNDLWWKEHQQTCGGKFTKVKEPEGYQEGRKKALKRKSDDGEAENQVKGGPELQKENSNSEVKVFSGKGHVLGATDSSSQPSTSRGTLANKTVLKPDHTSQSSIDKYFSKKFHLDGQIPKIASPIKPSASGSLARYPQSEDFPSSSNADLKSAHVVCCPICSSSVLESSINSHLDQCLT